MTTVADAQKVLFDLQTKMADARVWAAKVEESIAACSFAAHTGDAGARIRLDELHGQQSMAEQEAASLEAAIGEAKTRLQAAVAAEQDAAEIAKAKRALALCSAFAARGEALDRSLTKFLDDFQGLSSDFTALSGLGFGPGSWPLVSVNMRNAMLARLMFTDLQIEHLPPNRRHSFEEVINGWASHVRARAEARLNRDAPAKDEADKAA
jgi:hypothetical protein